MRQKRYIKADKFGFEPLVIIGFFLFSFFLMFHTFGYDGKTHTILIAGKLWSDFGSHIPLIRSFSMGVNSPPEYPIFPGEPIRYHFLFYALVGLLEKAGLRLDWALNVPSAIGFTLLLWGIWSLAKKLFGDRRVAALSVLFFLFNGSLSFIQFLKRQPFTFRDFPSFGPWDGGMITAFWNLNIYTNQRHLALAFAMGIWFLVWVASTSRQSVTPAHAGVQRTMKPFLHWIPAFAGMTFPSVFWGITIGILPYFHQPMLLIFAILLTWYFLAFPKLRTMLFITALTASLLILPQLTSIFSFARHPGLDPGSSMNKDWIPAFAGMTMDGFRSLWYPGYLVHDRFSFVNFLSFWFQNLGLHAILIPLGIVLLPKRTQKVLIPLFFFFIMGNLLKFSPEEAANHKFFNFALILGNMVTAYTIIRFLSPIKVITVITIITLILSGLIDFLVIASDTKGALADVGSPRCCSGEAGNNEAATWIAANTPKDAVFLNSSFLYHPASLAGRKIFLGWPYFAWSAGYDTYGRMAQMKTVYESKDPRVFCPLLVHHNISYITVEDTKNDPNLPKINTAYFQRIAPEFTDEKTSFAIYSTRALCGR